MGALSTDGLETLLRSGRARDETLLGVLFVALITGLHILNAAIIDGELLNFSGDWNVPTFASGLLFLVAGASCARTARRLGDDAEARAWWVIAVVVAALGVEAVIDMHGELESISGLRKPVLVAIPVLGFVAVVLLLRPLLAMRAPAPLLLIGGGSLLIATQAVAAFTGSTDIEGPIRRAASIVQEGGEMLSACFVLAAAAVALDLFTAATSDA